ncbi:MAG: uracil-DNA glycosylase [Chloroflexota bacterium]
MPFTSFLNQLANSPSTNILTNPYEAGPNDWNSKRLQNLRRYFEQMQTLKPEFLLVGEAPGYRGCRLSGIPFVSPQRLVSSLNDNQLFGIEAGYQPIEEWRDVWREASSTIVWQTITQLPQLPILWNACPFHPHKPNQPKTNRAPKTSELDDGRPFIHQLLTLFPIQTVVAVGNKADFALTRWDIPHEKVRHPSHGGKRPFQTQLFQLSENNAKQR